MFKRFIKQLVDKTFLTNVIFSIFKDFDTTKTNVNQILVSYVYLENHLLNVD